MDTKTIFTLSSFSHEAGHQTRIFFTAWAVVESLWNASVGAARDEEEIINELATELGANIEADELERDIRTLLVATINQTAGTFEWYCQGLSCSFVITRHEEV